MIGHLSPDDALTEIYTLAMRWCARELEENEFAGEVIEVLERAGLPIAGGADFTADES